MVLDSLHKIKELTDQQEITHRTDSSVVTLGVEVKLLEETKLIKRI